MGRPKTDFSHHCNKRSCKVALWGVSVTPESATYTYEGIHVFDILFGALASVVTISDHTFCYCLRIKRLETEHNFQAVIIILIPDCTESKFLLLELESLSKGNILCSICTF